MKNDYSLLLYEIIAGYSELRFGGEVVYFKHPTVEETLEEQVESRVFEDHADKIGLRSEQDLLEIALKSGKWTEEKQSEMEDIEFSVESSRKVLGKVKDQHMKNNLLEKIKNEEAQLKELKKFKDSLTIGSKERYVLEQNVKLFFRKKLFKDPEFKEPCDDGLRNSCIQEYNAKVGALSKEENLLWAVYTPSFFELFLIYKESPDRILGKLGIDMTLYQKRMMAYGVALINKITGGSLPEHVQGNPVSIYKWNGSNEPTDDEEDFSVRKKVEKHGGLENMKPEDKIT